MQSASESIIHACPYGSPQIKQDGISIRCKKVDPERHPADRIKIGFSSLVLATSGQRRWIASIPDAMDGRS
jgi:hypothetical protein